MTVYFISARELDLVKIGYAYNPVRRFKHLRTFSPVELTLEGAIPGDRNKERELHNRFRLARVRGEWFKLCPSLQAEIDNSTRPDKFTWAAVRVWLKGLIAEDDAALQAATPPAVLQEAERRFQVAMKKAAEQSRMSPLERLEADGAIHFPFRVKEPA